MENNNERSSMEIFEKDQKIAFVDSFSDAALSYEYEQAGFTINLMQRSVLLFNHNIKKNVMSSTLRKNMNSTFIYPYSNIREINYSLPDCRSDDAEICIMTDDILNPVWTSGFHLTHIIFASNGWKYLITIFYLVNKKSIKQKEIKYLTDNIN